MVTVTENQLGAELRSLSGRIVEAGRKAAYRAALRGVAVAVEATPVDEGIARAGWQARPTDDGAELFNDVPYAGVLEAGSRPHRPPLKPILEWVVRKFGLDLQNEGGSRRSFESIEDVPSETMALAMAVVESIEEKGTAPNWMIKDNLDELQKLLKQETERMLRKLGGGGGGNE